MYSLLVRCFDAFEAAVEGARGAVRGAWRALRDGPLQSLAFYLILGVTALLVLVRGALEALDALLERLEKGFIALALLLMTALSFADYLRREVPFFDVDIQGGPSMAVVLMVWVGFLGASLAVRERKHLAVDLSDRLLSPAAAGLLKRFTALVTAGFCWMFAGYATDLMEESLLNGTGQDALPLWDWLVPPLNAVAGLLFAEGAAQAGVIGGGLAVLAVVARVWHLPTRPVVRGAATAVGAAALLATGLALIGTRWNPVAPTGDAYYQWSPLLTNDAAIAARKTELSGLDAELDALVFGGDGGAAGEAGAPDAGGSAEELLAGSSAGQEFPMWMAQAVIPLSFLLMALRFLGVAFGRRPELAEGTPPAPTFLAETTGRGGRDLVFAGLMPGVLIGLGIALDWSTGPLIGLGSFLLLLTGAPLFLGIGTASLACVTLIQDFSGYTVAKDMYEAVKKEELLSIPFFVLAGNIMTSGSIAARLVAVARALMGRTPGGLGLATVFACVIFAAISGSSPVTVIAVGSIMFPMLMKERYPVEYANGVLASAGSLGIIIPPSVPMIVYAIMVSTPQTPVSPNDLFLAGVLPGLFIASMLALYTLYATRPSRKDIQIVEPVLEGGYLANLGRELAKSIPALLLPVLILGGIYGVLGPLKFTVTEAAAVGVVYALFVELVIHRELKLRKLPGVLAESGVMMGTLFLIIVLAMSFNKFLSEQYIPQDAAAWLGTYIKDKWLFLLLANLFLLALGCVMEIMSAILIVAPLLAPIAASFGIDPIHFGIIFIVNLEIGYLTPPMGINLFVASTVFNRPIVEVIRSVIPFLFIMLFSLVVITVLPWLSTALL